MAHNPNKKQRLSEFDFTSPDAHVAIVGKAANGKEKFLVMKNLNKEQVQKQDFLVNFQDPAMQKVLEAANEAMDEIKEELKGKPVVELPLEDLLKIFFYMWGEDAKTIAESVVMKSTETDKDALRKALLARLQSDSDRSGAVETGGAPTNVNKSKVEEMTEKAPEQVDVTKALADRDAQIADLQKALGEIQKREDAALLAKYEDVAKSLTAVGATVEDGKVLKAVAALEGGDKVLAMLTKAVDLIAKADKMNEKGVAVSSESEDKATKLANVAKSLAAEKGITFQAAYVIAAEQHPELV